MPLQKRRDEFFKVMVHTLYRTAVYNGCKKSVRMKLKIHRASNEESDVLSVYKRQQWGPNFLQNESSQSSQILPLTRETETN